MEAVVTNGKNHFSEKGLQTETGKGTQGAPTLSVKEYGDGVNHVTEIEIPTHSMIS